jgi:hypothetical protein
MTATTAGEETAPQRREASPDPMSRAVDWIVSILLVLGGLVFASVGFALSTAADRAWIADAVADGTIQSSLLSDADLVEATYAILWWGGVGLVVTGLLVAVAGVGFFLVRTRARRAGTTTRSRTATAVVGGTATIVLSVLPLSPILGGGIASYLLREDPDFDGVAGAKVGALAGLFASVPLVVLLLFLVAALVSAGLGVVGLVVGTAVGVTVVYMVGFAALGGYLGAAVARDEGVPAVF